MKSKKKIGVYICHCGGNISDYVDVEKVREAVSGDEIVFLSKTTMFACSDSNQRDMVEDIKEHQLDGVVVASCSPKLHLTTFRNVSERADLNKYTYVHANIREQASWAHSDNKMGATEKAIHLVQAAIAKAHYAEALVSPKIKTEKRIAVIGAGVAGMKAALSLADKDCEVILIEKEPFVGGRVAQWDTLSTTTETGKEMTTRLYNELLKRDNITIFTNSELISNKGSVGNIEVVVRKTPRYVKGSCHPEDLKRAIEVCPVEVPDEFNFRLTNRKAIYKNYPSEYPQTPVIDMKACTRCGECEKVCTAIDFTETAEEFTFHVGSVLMATGFDSYTPAYGEFGYATSDKVITLPQFKRMIDTQEGKLSHKGKEVHNIAYIYCVGSRQEEGGNTYCSRNCCTSTIHAAVTAKARFPEINNFHFNRGLRTYGKQEILYADSLRNGDIYLQSYEDGPPTVSTNAAGTTTVKINDILTASKELEVDADLVVLVTGMVPRADNTIGSLFKLPKGRDQFFNEIHMKLRPVETVIDGITIAGACQGPKNIAESVNSALSASTKSFSIVNKGELETEPLIAVINPDKCTWCGACEEACPFDAILKTEADGRTIAQINNSVCKGCGMCTPVCEPDAIDLIACSSAEIMSMIDALA